MWTPQLLVSSLLLANDSFAAFLTVEVTRELSVIQDKYYKIPCSERINFLVPMLVQVLLIESSSYQTPMGLKGHQERMYTVLGLPFVALQCTAPTPDFLMWGSINWIDWLVISLLLFYISLNIQLWQIHIYMHIYMSWVFHLVQW